MTDFVDAILSQVQRATHAALAEASRDVVDFVRDELSTPYPPASQPGESPHRRTGDLRDGVDADVVSGNDDRVEMAVWSERVSGDPRVPEYLEYGTERMAPRPYMSLAASVFFPHVPRRVAAYVSMGGGGA